MRMESFIYLLPHILSAAVSIWIGVLALRRGKVPGASPLAWIAFAEAEWSLAHIGQLVFPDLAAKLFWNNILFVGAVFTPLGCLGFALEYNTSRPYSPVLRWKILSIFSALLLVFIWTDGAHELFRRFPRVIPSVPFSVLIFDPGPAFEIYSIYAYSLVAIACLFLLVYMLNGSRLYRTQIALMLLGMLIPWITSVVTGTGLVPIKLYQITPISFGVSNLIIAFALFRYRLLEIIPVARTALIENVSDGVLVLDTRERVIDCNPSACQILGIANEGTVEKPVSCLIDLPADFLAADDLRPIRKTEIAVNGKGAQQVYEIELRQLLAGEKIRAGYLLVFHNITEQKKIEAQFRRSNALLDAAIQSSTNGVIVIDSDLSVVLYNRRLTMILELPERWENMYDSEKLRSLANCYLSPNIFYETLEDLVKNPEGQRLTTFETVNGCVLECSISPYLAGEEKTGWLFSYQDVTEQKLAEDKLRHLAITDSLTHVYNRRHFFSLAQNELNRAIRYDRDLSIILFDIDHFKSVNDTFGHLVGDQVLETLASYCKSNLRSFDIIGRYGGEEFIILLPETTLKRALEIAERLRKQALGIHIPTPEGAPGITISLGVAGIHGGDQLTLDELIGAADRALYKAKKAGRNQACAIYA